MKVSYKDGKYTISELTSEQLGSLRYALNEGTENLEQTARYMKSLGCKKYAASCFKTANDARSVNDALEAAVQNCIS